jgi:hypothetical protein
MDRRTDAADLNEAAALRRPVVQRAIKRNKRMERIKLIEARSVIAH